MFRQAQALAHMEDARYPKALIVEQYRTRLENLPCEGIPKTMTFVPWPEVDARQAFRLEFVS